MQNFYNFNFFMEIFLTPLSYRCFGSWRLRNRLPLLAHFMLVISIYISSNVGLSAKPFEFATAPASFNVAAATFFSSDGQEYHAFTTKQEDPARLILLEIGSSKVEVFDIPNATQSWGLVYDGDHRLYIGTRNSSKKAEVLAFDVDRKEFKHISYLNGASLVTSMSSYNNTIVIGTYPNAELFFMQNDQLLKGQYKGKGNTTKCLIDLGLRGTLAGSGSPANISIFNIQKKSTNHLILEYLKDESYVYSCSSDDRYVYLGTQPGGNFIVVDKESMKLIARHKIPATHTVDAISTDGQLIYFTARPSGALYQYSTVTKNIYQIAQPIIGEQHRALEVKEDVLRGVMDSGKFWKLLDGKIYINSLKQLGIKGKSFRTIGIHADDDYVYISGNNSLKVVNRLIPSQRHIEIEINGEAQALTSTKKFLYVFIYEGAKLQRIPKNVLDCADCTNLQLEYLGEVGFGHNRPSGAVNSEKGQIFLSSIPYPGSLEARLTSYDEKTGLIKGVSYSDQENISALAHCNGNIVAAGSVWGEGITNGSEYPHIFVIDDETLQLKTSLSVGKKLGTKKFHSVECNDQAIFVLTENGWVASLDYQGRLKWRSWIAFRIRHSSLQTKPSMSLANDMLYVTTGKKLLKINIQNQRKKVLSRGRHGFTSFYENNLYYTGDNNLYSYSDD